MTDKIIKLDLTLTQTYSLYVLDSDKENIIYNTEKFINQNINLKRTKEFINGLTLEDSSVDLTFDKEINDDVIKDPIYCLFDNSFPFCMKGRFHTFSEALEHLKQGGEIARQCWGNNNATGSLSLSKNGKIISSTGAEYSFSTDSILATDWVFKD